MTALLKKAMEHIFPDRILGAIDYMRFPSLATSWGGPFNGQPARRALFREIVAKLHPCAIVETGTYLGTTTAFMAQTGLPVYTIEAHPRKYGFVRVRFWRTHNIILLHEDTRTALRKLLGGPLGGLRDRSLLFYLDAHWNEDLPLAEEIEIIFGRCQLAVVMVDDFQVPGDPGYGYDDYGCGKSLTVDYIAPVVLAYGLQSFYPATPSITEGGWRRGCVVLAHQASLTRKLDSMPLLRRATEAELRSLTVSPGPDAMPRAR
jgi:hypothetical protein